VLTPPNTVGAEKLTSVFGDWPRFHDAEIIAAQLIRDRDQPKSPRLELMLRWWLKAYTWNGHSYPESDSQITLRFHNVDQVELSEFNHQNVVDSLTISSPDDNPDWLAVDLNSSFGLLGSFRCRSLEVVEVIPFEPARA
jgi:hypothetical protein